MSVSNFLREVSFFQDITDDDFNKMCRLVGVVDLKAGEQLFAEGDIADRVYIVQEGEIEVIKSSLEREVLLSVGGPKTVIGEMALVAKRPRNATVRARTDAVLLAIHNEQFTHFMMSSPTLSHHMFNMAMDRWRHTESRLHQSEKMAQLGTLTAGIAHELNNPAAAAQRASEQLLDAMTQLTEAQSSLNQLSLDDKQYTQLNELAAQAKQAAQSPPEMDALARSDQEYELETWLEGRNIDNAWKIAPLLVNLDFDPDRLEVLADCFTPEQLMPVVTWLASTYTNYNLVAEIKQASSRISGIVKAFKSYSYLDQAPVQSVNIHEGLNDTLLIMRNKLKSGINVRREYAESLPEIQGYGSELNQVWTNIIDNAIYVLGEGGEIVIRTRLEGAWIIVEIQDNGPGIPEDVLPRIFEAFYTTKPVGKGTGLGLEITQGIIVQKHRGDIKVFSEPGKTCFQIWLPLDFNNPTAPISQ